MQKQASESGAGQKAPGNDNQPPDPEGVGKATRDNDLTTGHTTPGDGGDDNAKPAKDK
jgi:hypothetical protein